MTNKTKILCKEFLDLVLHYALSFLVPRQDVVCSQRKTLVIAPHPDDETLACGATIARLRAQGQQVLILVISDGSSSTLAPNQTRAQLSALRRQEALNAATMLGVDLSEVIFLAYPDGALLDHRAKIAQEIEAKIRHFAPTMVIAPHVLDAHPDHKATAQVVRMLSNKRAITCPVYEYLVWLPTKKGGTFLWRMITEYRQIKMPTEKFLQTKRAAFDAYQSQTGGDHYERGKGFLSHAFLTPFFSTHERLFEKKGRRLYYGKKGLAS